MATPTVVSAQLLSWVLWVLVWAAALLLATVLGTRAGRQWRERRDAKLLGELRPAMLEVASGEDDDASALRRLTAVPRRRVPVVDRAVSAMLSKVRGSPPVPWRCSATAPRLAPCCARWRRGVVPADCPAGWPWSPCAPSTTQRHP